MFRIDPAMLPSLSTRKALLVLDPQNDFLDEDGALPVLLPMGLPTKIAEFATAFRQNGGLIIWVSSKFERSRPITSEHILLGNRQPQPASAGPVRGRRLRQPPPDDSHSADPEAFLTQSTAERPMCARPGTTGGDIHPTVKEAVLPKDHHLIKSHYSAFQSEQLLRLLRSRFVHELFICGAYTNVGIMATVMDAAKYAFDITIVDDCCGFRNIGRHRLALRFLADETECNSSPSSKVLEAMSNPKSKLGSGQAPKGKPTAAARVPNVRHRKGEEVDGDASPVSRLHTSLENLSLNGESAADEPELSAHAQDHVQPLQPVGSPEPPTEEPSDRDVLGPTLKTGPDSSANSAACSPVTANGAHEMSAPQEVSAGEGPPLCEGDTHIIYDILPTPLVETIFERLKKEVAWQRMSHQGGEVPRLVAVQGQVGEDGSMPIYRHPADESPPLLPFSPTVADIKEAVERKLGHPLNHVLIQFYRSGNDYISEHSDKTLDIAKDSFIANVSLGAERTMTFRTKRPPRDRGKTQEDEPAPEQGPKRQIQRARLPHNSLCRMGLKTNEKWLHAIRQDKRLDREKTEEELAYDNGRISLTFRRIGTFLDGENRRIWGQGAKAKTKAEAGPVVNGQTPEAIEMLRAFGRENQSSDFDWDAHYGSGFDVLNLSAAPRLFLCSDPVVNMRVQYMLAELGIGYARGSVSAQGKGDAPSALPVRFVDNNAAKSSVEGQLAIMLYLQQAYAPADSRLPADPSALAAILERFQHALTLLDKWRATDDGNGPSEETGGGLARWEQYVTADGGFIAGTADAPTLADYAFWPLLLELRRGDRGADLAAKYPNLAAYHERMAARPAGRQVLDAAKTGAASLLRRRYGTAE
ncbi:hypothetical protein F4780DRAFT_771645 [Xylariomycetidae sp. FL0641]|nr:hypothetical protein F4780DRAFT_771645 [Xylariomycetidae sp. FL0641]